MISTHSSYQRLADVLGYLVDDRVGIIKYVGEFPREAGGPDFFHFFGQACDTSAFTSQKNFANAGGASTHRERALAKAIGEAVERYCSAIFHIEDFPLSSYESAPFRCISPDEFALYSSGQYGRPDFPYTPFNKTTPVRWAEMTDPLTDEIWNVPASMVFMPYFYDKNAGERSIAQPISTGLACHCSWEEAAMSAIGEVVERDAFTIAWQARLSMPKIRLETLSPQNRDLVSRFHRAGYSVTILHITLDHGIPTILSVLQHKAPDVPAMVFAASADLDPEKAICNSLEELAHTRRLASHLKATRPPLSPDVNHETIVDQQGHVHLYCDQKNVSLASFIFSSKETIDFEEIENLSTGDRREDLTTYHEKIKSVGHRVLLRDLTTPDVMELGLTVLRAVLPGFHPLFMGYLLRALGGHRLWTVPQKLGYQGITPESGDNPLAHPYP